MRAGVADGRAGDPAAAEVPSELDLAAAMLSMTVSPSDEGPVAAEGRERPPPKRPPARKLAVHEVFALRILANTKHRIAALRDWSQLGGGWPGPEDVVAAPEDEEQHMSD